MRRTRDSKSSERRKQRSWFMGNSKPLRTARKLTDPPKKSQDQMEEVSPSNRNESVYDRNIASLKRLIDIDIKNKMVMKLQNSIQAETLLRRTLNVYKLIV